MKKLILFIFILLLIILSGCSRYTSEYVDQLEEKWSNEYMELEEKYSESLEYIDKLETAIGILCDEYPTIHLFLEDDEDISKSDAIKSDDKIVYAFLDLGL